MAVSMCPFLNGSLYIDAARSLSDSYMLLHIAKNLWLCYSG